MGRLGVRARICLCTLTPLVAICVLVTISQQVSGRLGYVLYTVYPSESSLDYPSVRTILAERVTAQSGLQPGDVLQSADGRSLQGTGPITFYAAIVKTPPSERPVRIVFERDGKRMETVLDISPEHPKREIVGLVLAISLSITGALILLRAPRDRKSLPMYLAMTGYALDQAWFPGGPEVFTYAWVGVFALGEAIFAIAFVLSAMLWIERRLPWWALALPFLLGMKALLRMNSLHEVWWPADLSMSLFLTLDMVMISTGFVFSIANYLNGDALERRKLRWVFLGLAVGTLPVLVVNLMISIRPDLLWVRPWFLSLALVIPVGYLVAITRYDFLDIDRLIGATASVGLLGFGLLAGMLLLIPGIAEQLGASTGVDPKSAQLFLSIAGAAIIIPGDRALRPRIERFFFRERYALQAGVESVLVRLAACPSPGDLTETVGEELDSLLQPDVCAIYAPTEGILAPVFNRGWAVPPAIDGGGSLARLLAQRRSAIGARELGGDLELGLADRAVIDALGAAVLLPVMVGRSLQYLICLGTKRSGDIYTQTDLALLGRVADKVSAELLRFDDAEIIREGRVMQESLRRYVPGAIADHLSMGRDLEASEREVSVLFVDIRGYTSISQSLEAGEIFSTVNRYTETVSRTVTTHGGSVVEFNGDGMMAVFGAPGELPNKEQCAVEASREIVARVAELEPAAPVAGAEKLSCGVGVATGPAFVGNIRAVDRYIWTAIGNTTNLAARLEAVTRDVDASIVIDAPTHGACGDAALGFSKKDAVSIRGRTEPQDLYVLPLSV